MSKHILAAVIFTVFPFLVGCESIQTTDLSASTSVVLSTVTPLSASITPSMLPPTPSRTTETNTPVPTTVPPIETPTLQPTPEKTSLEEAMDQLGEDFDIKAFHNQILGNGNLPQDILRNVVNDWIMTSTL